MSDTTGSEDVQRLLERAAAAGPSDASFNAFTRIVLSGADATAREGVPDDVLVETLQRAFEGHAQKPAGGHRSAVSRMHATTAGGSYLSLVLLVNDDMPFIVDSVIGELQARGHMPLLVLHPILKTERNGAGMRERIVGAGDANWADGMQESIFAAVIDEISDAAASELAGALDSVLRDVRSAVADWRPMVSCLEGVVRQFERAPPQIAPGVLSETLEFCRWLIDGQFTFLGMRAYRLVGDAGSGTLEPVEDSGFGVLRDPGVPVLSKGGKPLEITPEIRRQLFAPHPLLITKSDMRSRVHRHAYMDYVGLKTYGADGRQNGELRMVGLFTSQAYTERPGAIPLLRQKVEAVLRRTGYAPGSHDGKMILNVIEHFPRDELFQIRDDMLAEWARAILDLDLRPRVRLLIRRDGFDRFVSALVYVPRERFSTQIRAQIGDALARGAGGHVSAFTPFFPEAALIRVHYIIGRVGDAPAKPFDAVALEGEINEIAQMWTDRLCRAMEEAGSSLRVLRHKYRDAFPSAYAETFTADRAIDDIARIEDLSSASPVGVAFQASAEGGENEISARIYQFDRAIPLSERVPVLENFGFRSIDERSYRVRPRVDDGLRRVVLHDMRLVPLTGDALDPGEHAERLKDAFLAVRFGHADNDPFNRLVVAARADWRSVAMLRAYAAYMRQIQLPYGMRYVSDTLLRYPSFTQRLIEMFRVRFDPDIEEGVSERAAAADAICADIKAALKDVPSLDEDRILSAYADLIQATKRTNFYQTNNDSVPPETISYKLAPREVPGVPEPAPEREIWSYSPRVEGVHLRFGPIARGGIRWSDRAQDFRTEVLGLCKAQQVKNTVIVPEGSKGGFFPKRLPLGGTREDITAEAVTAYRTFITSLLEITDNMVEGVVVPPERVVRHDDGDPYLVVAADKGTATFSDFANEISTTRGFWLGDAFASGGSAGYDHKKMGITARGAWECVKRHFREIDVDIQTAPFTAIGVGDMSGDVFGNGMLLSEQTRLLAAFDHRDIFIDPAPDAAVSYQERRRLFDLGRSSWQDYDRAKLSAGGGVFPRAAKSIALTPEIKALLGLAVEAITPNELIRAILQSEADLLWFGGIGTYVRAPSEVDADVGDRANDPIRITSDALRVKVIGEGANLGITQPGRVAFAERGGRINTDFIDNSAGVNSSDKEVNIKIAAGRAVVAGRLDLPARNVLLAEMTEDVARDCLWNNYQQSLAISLSERRGARDIALLARLMNQLEEQGLVKRELEGLPGDAEIAARLSQERPFTRPEIAVLMSWAKIALTSEIMQTSVPDDPSNLPLLTAYFPAALQERYHDDILEHPLRREIVATRIVNSMINRAGPAMLVRIRDATGRDVADIAAAFMAVREIYGLPELWTQIDALDTQVGGAVQLDLYSRTQGLLLDQTAELLRLGGEVSVSAMVGNYAQGVAEVTQRLRDCLMPEQLSELNAAIKQYVDAGVPAGLAEAVARIELLKHAPAIVRIAQAENRPIGLTARIAFAAMDFFNVGDLQERSEHLHVTDYYDRLALSGALGAGRSASRSLTRDVLRSNGSGDVELEHWMREYGSRVQAAKRQIEEIIGKGELTISRLTVAASQIRELMSDI